MLHFGEIMGSNEFRQYDYGSEDANLKVYASAKPPLINLTNIVKTPVKVAMIVGK